MGARLLISARWYDPGHRPNRPKAWPRTPTPVIAWIDLGPALSPNMHAEQGGHIMRTLFSDPPDELGAEPCCASMERCEVCGHPLRCTVHGWGLFGVRQRCGPCSSAKPSEEPKTCDRCLHAYTSSTHEPCRSCLKTSKVSRSWTRWEPRYFAKPSEAASLRAQVATLTRERLEALEKAAGRERQLSRAWENERAAESALTAARGALAEVKRRAALPIQTHVRGLATTEEQLSAAITSCVKQAVEHVSEPARAALAATAPAVAETTAGCATCGDQGTVEEMIGFGGENPELVMEPCPSCSPPPSRPRSAGRRAADDSGGPAGPREPSTGDRYYSRPRRRGVGRRRGMPPALPRKGGGGRSPVPAPRRPEAPARALPGAGEREQPQPKGRDQWMT